MAKSADLSKSFVGDGLWDASSLTLPSYPIRVSVEGIIGSGKSVLLQGLEKKLTWLEVIQEDIKGWRNLTTENGVEDLFEKFYAYPAKFAFSFQSHVMQLLSLCRSTCDFVVMERSLHSSCFVFAPLLRERGFLSSTEMAVLTGWHSLMGQMSSPEILTRQSAVLFLDLSPELAFERVQLRGRREEAAVDVSYLRDLQRLHESWFEQVPSFPQSDRFQLVRLDASKSAEAVLADAIGQLTLWKDWNSDENNL